MASVTIESMSRDDVAPDDRLCDDMEGQDQEKLMGTTEVNVMSILTILMGHFAMVQNLGRVVVEMLFDLGASKRHFLKPDIAFVSFVRWPKSREIPPQNAFRIVPDLVVEVVSPSNSANEVEEKIVEYLEAGVRQVWAVYPITGRVYIFDGSTTVKIISGVGELDGGEIIPGFQMPVRKLFEVETEPD